MVWLQVIPELWKLRDMMATHLTVLDDVLENSKRAQSAIQRNIVLMREETQRARMLYLMRVMRGKVWVWL